MKRRNRKRKNPSPFNFEKLEPRQLLAGDLGELNLLTNGDFEQVPATSVIPTFHDSEDVAGWNAVNALDGQQIVLFTFGTGDDANTVLKLDSIDSQIDHVFQDVATEANTTYTLTFDLRGQEPDSDVIVENLEVFWNDELVGTFESGSLWTTHAIIVDGINGNSQLEFREQGATGGDGVGVLIDNVNLAVATDSLGVTNGSFETVNGNGPFFSNGEVPGFGAIDFGNTPGVIQIQANGDNLNAPATDGVNVLNLDTTSDVVDHVFSDFTTTAGQSYFVVFDVFSDGDQTTDANRDEVRVRWKTPDSEILTNQWIATIIGNGSWQTYAFQVEGLGDVSRLELREPGGLPGDGSGALIDNVRLFEIEGAINALAVDANGDSEDGTTATAEFVQGAASLDVATELTLSNANSDNLTDATITITGSPAQSEDVLSIVPGDSGITQSFDSATGTLSLVGTASVETWQSVLRTLQYQNNGTSPTVGNREISIIVSDDTIIGSTQESSAAIIDVNVVSNQLSIAAIPDQTVEAGSPLFVTLDIDNPADVSLSFAGESDNASILTPRFESGESWRLNISAPDAFIDGVSTPLSGEITFQLFEEIYGDTGSRATDRIRLLTEQGFYDGTVFHRVARNDVAFSGDNAGDPFVIQGGDPTATGTGGSDLGEFDDQFNTLLQHNRTGLLSYAKSLDDTNDSQFFVTAGPTRFLDFNHSIFGVLTSGEELREQINAVDTNGQTPTGDVTITSAEIYQDNERAALLLVAPEGVTGETTVTVTVRDANGNETTQTVNVNVVAPTGGSTDSNPFLDDIPDLEGSFGVPGTFQLTAQDVEGDNVRFLDLDEIENINSGLASNFQFPQIAIPPFQSDSSFEYSVDIDTGLITFTPGSLGESPETVQFLVGVAQEPRLGEPINNGNVDLQVVTINLS